MNTQRLLSQWRKLKSIMWATVTLIAFLVLCVVGMVSSTAQSTQDQAAASSDDERKFENTIPQHVPLRVKLRNEQSFKSMKNKNWLRELEVEVENTGSKPIYYLYVTITLPEVIVQGHKLGMQVVYGRPELVDLDTALQPDDVPIAPGGSVTLKVPMSQVKGYEGLRDEEKRDDPKRIDFSLQLINFGDGTGLITRQGVPIPDPAREKSQNEA